MAEGGNYPQHDLADRNDEPSTSGGSGSATLANGECVEVKISNSSVTVAGRDVIHKNTNITYITNMPAPAQADNLCVVPAKIRKVSDKSPGNPPHRSEAGYHSFGVTETNNDYLIETINMNTKRRTCVRILNEFQDEGLAEPSFAVYPKMSRIPAEDYYKGQYGVETTDYIPGPATTANQLVNEVQFGHRIRYLTESITIDEIMASIWEEKEVGPDEALNVTSIIASAGSGKTTLLRRMARKALRLHPEIKHRHQKMVHYIELKDIREEECTKSSRFLFHGYYKSEIEEKQAFEWLVENQTDAILFFDGLDQTKWVFDRENLRNINNYESASTSTIMHNILSRNILPHVTIFITSREFKISELPARARPRNIITMEGLTTVDAKRLFIYLLGGDGEVLWEKIETMSASLIHLITVPVFLILTAIVMGRDPDRDPPSTITELYTRIIMCLRHVENIRNRREINAIINKLKKMAYEGMMEGRVLFQQRDLTENEISTDEVQDLLAKVPGKNLLSRHLMEAEFDFYFCHQSIQEFLAANFVAEMSLDDFSLFVKTHLHRGRWSVVRRFVAGIIFSKSPHGLHGDSKKKQEIISRSILTILGYVLDDDDHCEDFQRTVVDHFFYSSAMELYTVIYESDDENFMRRLSVICVSGQISSPADAHIVKTLATRCGDLESLALNNNGKDDNYLESILKSLKDKREETSSGGVMEPQSFREVNLDGNKFSAAALRSFLGLEPEIRSKYFDWRVVNVDSPGCTLEMVNNGDVIEISHKKKDEPYDVWIPGCFVKGSFSIKESMLKFEIRPVLDILMFILKLIEPKSIQMPDNEIYVEQDILRIMSHFKLEMKKMLLRIANFECIDWSLIRDAITKYKVQCLHIAVKGETSVKEYEDMKEHIKELCNSSVEMNIHWMLKVENEHEIIKVQETCRQNRIGLIRSLIRRRPAVSSLYKIIPPVNNVRNLTLVFDDIYDDDDDIYDDDDDDDDDVYIIGEKDDDRLAKKYHDQLARKYDNELAVFKKIAVDRGIEVLNHDLFSQSAWHELDDRCRREEIPTTD